MLGYFSTMFLLDFVSWTAVACFWGIIIAICTTLAIMGIQKEKKSKNPLKGIMDVGKEVP